MSVDFGAVNPVIKNLTFSNFKISFNGATVYAVGALIENCVFGGNVADGPEGRCCTVYVAADSTAAIRNCTFAKNSARATSDESTAGIRSDSTGARVVNTVFYGNEHSLGASLKHSVARFMHGTYDTAFVNCAADHPINSGCRTIDGTVFADWTNGDYSPHGKSRLINRGSATSSSARARIWKIQIRARSMLTDLGI